MKQTFYYNDPKKYSYNKMIDVNTRKETLLYEGNTFELLKSTNSIIEINEYNIISTPNFSELKEVKKIQNRLNEINPNPDKVVQQFSSVDYDIFLESMIAAGSAEMDVYLEGKLYRMFFIISRTVEYSTESIQLGLMDKHLYFVVDIQNVVLDNVPNNTITYLKQYMYKTLK